MKSKSLILMVLSLGFGLVAAIGINQVMKRPVEGDTNVQPHGPVLVAAGVLDLKTELTEENVKIENWPVNIIPPEAVSSLEDITDMVTLSRMHQGMPIVKGSIRHKNIVSTPKVPLGMKVVAVRVAADDTIGNLLEPGNKVDVIGVFKTRDATTNRTTVNSRTFLKALQVYSIGNKTEISASDENNKRANASSIVGLLVNEKQSEALVFVQDTGSIKLVLRGDDEENDGEVGPLEEIIEKLADKKPASMAREDKAQLDIWKGNSLSTTTMGSDGSRQAGSDNRPSGSDNRPSGSGNRGPSSDDDFSDVPPLLNGNDQGESGSRGDNDRGIDDDQYRGE